MAATTCCLGALTGLFFSLYLATWPPFASFAQKWDQVNSHWSELIAENLPGVAAGVIIGGFLGLLCAIGPFGMARRDGTAPAWSMGVAVCAFLWVCLVTVIGISIGGWWARSSFASTAPSTPTDHPLAIAVDNLADSLDVILREHRYRPWGAAIGALVGFGLFLGFRALCSCESGAATDLAAENERLRDEVSRLRENKG
jgi:hypothetical protein